MGVGGIAAAQGKITGAPGFKEVADIGGGV